MPNGTYGGVKGWRKSTLFDCKKLTSAAAYMVSLTVIKIFEDGKKTL